MNRGSTTLLKAVLFLMALVVLTFCVVLLPQEIQAELAGDFDYLPLLIGLYFPALPFLYAIFQAHRLLVNVDEDRAFSEQSVDAFKKIKYCSLAISSVFAVGMPYIFYLADQDDAPGLAALGFVIVGAAFVIATAAAIAQKLLQNVVEIKTENDLTV